jgi:hypothetical protein
MAACAAGAPVGHSASVGWLIDTRYPFVPSKRGHSSMAESFDLDAFAPTWIAVRVSDAGGSVLAAPGYRVICVLPASALRSIA